MGVSGDRKISQLAPLISVGQSDEIPIVNSGSTKKVTRANLLNIIDSLTSNSSKDPLSANQGLQLASLIRSLIKRDTYDGLTSAAVADPTQMFLGYATDTGQLLFYCADVSKGEAGFLLVAGG